MFKQETITKVMDKAREHQEKYNAMFDAMQDWKLCISAGNRKIGRVMNVSTMPGMCCGNCSHCIVYCYDVKACAQYPNTVIDARMRNTVMLLRNRPEFFRRIDDAISRRRKNKYFRWHVAGDILDMDYFENMVSIARKHPDFVFWTYTKMYSIVNAWIASNGELPGNLTIMFSDWDGVELPNPYNMPVFSCKLKAGNKNHPVEYFDSLFKCPGNCDVCKAIHAGCIAGMDTYNDEH